MPGLNFLKMKLQKVNKNISRGERKTVLVTNKARHIWKTNYPDHSEYKFLNFILRYYLFFFGEE